MNGPELVPFRPEWPEPAARFLRAEMPPAPILPLTDVLSSSWSKWILGAAEAKSAPPDYVLAALLAAIGSLIGNNRWSSPWSGWAEPPILWTMMIGNPSMNKSPGIDAVIVPMKRAERSARQKMKLLVDEWRIKAEVAEVAHESWRKAVKSAIKEGKEPPEKPNEAFCEPEPSMPRLAVSDATIEKLGVIMAAQPRGMLVARDELAGWLHGMSRYSGGGSDRPFWLEAYGGRAYSVERMGREPVYIDRLTIGVLGGIQPDRLRSLLLRTDDDGLLARFIPIWPEPAPIKRPSAAFDDAFIDRAFEKLLSLKMATDEDGTDRPWVVSFDDAARKLMDRFRIRVREWENASDGLLLSFIGKMPGLVVRLSLVLGMLDWAVGDAEEPRQISPWYFGRAAHLIEAYYLPMAKRAYADASYGQAERSARRLVVHLQELCLRQFTAREVLRMEWSGLTTAALLKPALAMLEEADIVRKVPMPSAKQGGRRQMLYSVNPAVLEVRP